MTSPDYDTFVSVFFHLLKTSVTKHTWILTHYCCYYYYVLVVCQLCVSAVGSVSSVLVLCQFYVDGALTVS